LEKESGGKWRRKKGEGTLGTRGVKRLANLPNLTVSPELGGETRKNQNKSALKPNGNWKAGEGGVRSLENRKRCQEKQKGLKVTICPVCPEGPKSPGKKKSAQADTLKEQRSKQPTYKPKRKIERKQENGEKGA